MSDFIQVIVMLPHGEEVWDVSIKPGETCPHDDAGEGDWCYSCWTNIKTGEVVGVVPEKEIGK